MENKVALLGMGLFVLLVLFSYVGPHIYVTNQHTVNPVNSNLPPSSSSPSAPTARASTSSAG